MEVMLLRPRPERRLVVNAAEDAAQVLFVADSDTVLGPRAVELWPCGGLQELVHREEGYALNICRAIVRG